MNQSFISEKIAKKVKDESGVKDKGLEADRKEKHLEEKFKAEETSDKIAACAEAYFSAYVVISLIAPRSSNHVTGDLTARDPVSGLPDSKSSSHLVTEDMIAPPVLFEVPLLHQFIKNIN